MGTMQVTLDEDTTTEKGKVSSIQSGGFIAFASGKNDYVASMPCEIYPEVRRLWAGWIDRMLDTGVDGVDIRVSSHGNLVDEPRGSMASTNRCWMSTTDGINRICWAPTPTLLA